jgi:ring-1,2-phenylacetyl-CoA epoxidase subunit PaaD
MPSDAHVMQILSKVKDPEIPVLTVEDLGIIRSVEIQDAKVIVTITPTYSGCPAMDVIEKEILAAFRHDDMKAEVLTVLSPAWTTDWISENGKRKLLEAGIVPPQGSASKLSLLKDEPTLTCPKCESENTQIVSQFGSTACKALHKCNECLEPFEYFKCL